jgi:hypothetical protein
VEEVAQGTLWDKSNLRRDGTVQPWVSLVADTVALNYGVIVARCAKIAKLVPTLFKTSFDFRTLPARVTRPAARRHGALNGEAHTLRRSSRLASQKLQNTTGGLLCA